MAVRSEAPWSDSCAAIAQMKTGWNDYPGFSISYFPHISNLFKFPQHYTHDTMRLLSITSLAALSFWLTPAIAKCCHNVDWLSGVGVSR